MKHQSTEVEENQLTTPTDNSPNKLTKLWKSSRYSWARASVFIAVFTLFMGYIIFRSFAASPNITIDYSSESNLNPFAFAMDETGYQSPNVLANDSLEVQRFKTLGNSYMRMHLVFDPTGKIVCGGGGCDTGSTGDQWIASIKQTRATPVVVVNESGSANAANMVKHFNVNPLTGQVDPSLPNYVKYWLIGNEPDLNGISVATYSSDFNADNDAMKAVDPSIKIGGPTTAWLDDPFVPTFIQNSGSRVDFIDFHAYPSSTSYAYADFFNWAQGTGNGINKVNGWLNQYAPSRASQIFTEVGEWSLDPSNLYAVYGPNGRNLTKSNFNVVWGADVIGQIIKNGGVAMHYGTKGNVVAWSSGYRTDYDTGQQVYLNLDDPQAPYHAYGMWTGEGLFRGFGTRLTRSSTTLNNVDVFASDNQKNIVVINKDPANAQAGIFQLNGVNSGTIDVWQHSQGISFKDPAVHLGSFNFLGSTFSYNLPALSATTFIVTPGATSTAPTVTLSANPSNISTGQSSTLSWTSTNATSCTDSGGWSGTSGTSGSRSVNPMATTSYTLVCTGAGGTASASTTISLSTVSSLPGLKISGSPLSIVAGKSSTLTWASTNATACTASGGWSGNQSTNGNKVVTPLINTTYTLSCSGAGGTATASTTVAVSSVQQGRVVSQDNFTRTNQSHWGIASDGQVWSGDVTSVSNFSISGNTGQVSGTSNSYNAVLGPVLINAQVVFSGSVSSFSSSNIGSVLRWSNSSNLYKAYIDGSNLVLQKRVNGIATTLGSVPFQASVNTNYTLRFQIIGTTLYTKVWRTGTVEPSAWMIQKIDSSLTSGRGGLRMLPQTGHVNYTAFTLYSE
jgi:hypothetical protein